MITFTDAPPDDPRGNGLDLVRTPTARPLIAAITSERVIGCPTHFWGGRTVPHDDNECEPCLNGSRWLWHGYLGALDLKTGEHFLFEMTDNASKPFKEWHKQHETLRGAKFEACRPKKTINGRVVIRLASIDLIKCKIPPAPNVMACLSIIWHLPLGDLSPGPQMNNVDQVIAERGLAEIHAAAARRAKEKPNGQPPRILDPIIGGVGT